MTVYHGAKGLAKLAAKQKRSIGQVARSVAFEVASDVIERTPVDQGVAKGSWTPSLNKAPSSFSETKSKSGIQATTRAGTVANKLQIGGTFYLLSNLVYMPPLEYGWSMQAPSGMVRIAIDNINKSLAKALKDVNK